MCLPNPDDLRELVNEKLGRAKKVAEAENGTPRPKTLPEIFRMFLVEGARERDWTSAVHYKYEQIWKQLMSCDRKVTLETLDKDKMVELKATWAKVAEQMSRFTVNTSLKILFEILKGMILFTAEDVYNINMANTVISSMKPPLSSA